MVVRSPAALLMGEGGGEFHSSPFEKQGLCFRFHSSCFAVLFQVLCNQLINPRYREVRYLLVFVRRKITKDEKIT